jgi:hypothetical protein
VVPTNPYSTIILLEGFQSGIVAHASRVLVFGSRSTFLVTRCLEAIFVATLSGRVASKLVVTTSEKESNFMIATFFEFHRCYESGEESAPMCVLQGVVRWKPYVCFHRCFQRGTNRVNKYSCFLCSFASTRL